MVQLFTPFRLKDVTLKNRVVVSPMCQYQAVDGIANEWHFAHYASLGSGGSGLVLVEATAVSPEGRITAGCTGIWNDEQTDALGHIAKLIKAGGAIPGIQIGHAGRKASLLRPWEGEGDTQMPDDDPGSWQPIAPSAIAFGGKMSKPPREMTLLDIQRVQAAFVSAAKRAQAAGYEWLELHFAHGFLAQTFFSASSNVRNDGYGGDYAGRTRFLTETLGAVRRVWPDRLPLTVKFGCIEFDGRDEERLPDVIVLLKDFKNLGVDLLDASIGFNEPTAEIPWGPGMMVPLADRMRRETGLAVGVSWGVEAPELAESIIAEAKADLVYLAKAMLANPRYPFRLAAALGHETPASVLPISYAHWLKRYALADVG